MLAASVVRLDHPQAANDDRAQRQSYDAGRQRRGQPARYGPDPRDSTGPVGEGFNQMGHARDAELFQTIPNLIFVLTIVVILGSTLTNIVIAIGIVSWTPIARMTRAEFLALRDREFVQACRAMGMGDFRIIAGEILPNALPPVIVLSSLVVAGAILFESAVSFLGLGDPNVASWGRLVGDGRQLIRSSWYICAIPGVAIMITVLCLNLIGDGLNDALNPKLRDR